MLAVYALCLVLSQPAQPAVPPPQAPATQPAPRPKTALQRLSAKDRAMVKREAVNFIRLDSGLIVSRGNLLAKQAVGQGKGRRNEEDRIAWGITDPRKLDHPVRIVSPPPLWTSGNHLDTAPVYVSSWEEPAIRLIAAHGEGVGEVRFRYTTFYCTGVPDTMPEGSLLEAPFVLTVGLEVFDHEQPTLRYERAQEMTPDELATAIERGSATLRRWSYAVRTEEKTRIYTWSSAEVPLTFEPKPFP